jgi:hypothetical protein
MSEGVSRRCAELQQKLREYEALLKQRDAEIARLKSFIRTRATDRSIPARFVETPGSEKTSGRVSEAKETPAEVSASPSRTGSADRDEGEVEPTQEVGASGKTPEASQEGIETGIGANLAADSLRLVAELEEARTASDVSYSAPSLPADFRPGRFLAAVIEGESKGEELCALFARLTSCDREERLPVLQRMSIAHLSMTHEMMNRMDPASLTWEKRLFIRYGMTDETLMADRMDVWERLYEDHSAPEETGTYHVDEWLEAVAAGGFRFSSMDRGVSYGEELDQEATGRKALVYELFSTGQMQGMCVGPGGNKVTILAPAFCSLSTDNPVVNRQWLAPAIDRVRKCDYRLFVRSHKDQAVEMQPVFILFPGYGNLGACWDPCSVGNSGLPAPRICLCSFPSCPSMQALLTGLGDYLWEFAKAEARQHWTTEGLTGDWLRLFKSHEQAKDPKTLFVASYVDWILKEAQRVPVLEKRFREFMWHHAPFSDEVKDRIRGSTMFEDLFELDDVKKVRQENDARDTRRLRRDD